MQFLNWLECPFMLLVSIFHSVIFYNLKLFDNSPSMSNLFFNICVALNFNLKMQKSHNEMYINTTEPFICKTFFWRSSYILFSKSALIFWFTIQCIFVQKNVNRCTCCNEKLFNSSLYPMCSSKRCIKIRFQNTEKFTLKCTPIQQSPLIVKLLVCCCGYI
jgi:hypothetical protein